MKNSKLLLMTAGVFLIMLTFQSCLGDDSSLDTLYPNALVTVKPVNDKSFFLQLDDNTTLYPVNIKISPYAEKEVRALVNYEEVNESSNGYSKAVHINWIDSILTKTMVPNLGTNNDSKYGTDAVEIVNDWVTIAEDGYLTLHIRFLGGSLPKKHLVNLVASADPAKPYEVEFRHDACGDDNDRIADGLVAFRLNMLPDTNGKTVKLKLKWKSFNGEKSVEFDYRTRPASATEHDDNNVINALN